MSANKDFAEDVNRIAHDNFTYVPDQFQYGKLADFRSHDISKPFRDDCDGFAGSCARALVEGGIPKDKVMLTSCWVRQDKADGSYHEICVFEDDDGWMYALDNRHSTMYPLFELGYVLDKYMRMSEPGKWFLWAEKVDG